jgi:hypothetical protein
MPDVVRRLVERRAAQLVVAAAAGDQEIHPCPGPPRGFPCWRADAGFPSDRLRPARREGVTEGALFRLVLEQGGGHTMILPSLVILSHRTVTVRTPQAARGFGRSTAGSGTKLGPGASRVIPAALARGRKRLRRAGGWLWATH